MLLHFEKKMDVTSVAETNQSERMGEENHFDKTVEQDKRMVCAKHNNKPLVYYCFKCQVPVCNDCVVVGEHKNTEHQYELINEAVKLERKDIERLMVKAKSEIYSYNDASVRLQKALGELHSQYVTAHDKLNRLHFEEELKIVNQLCDVDKCVEKKETACTFGNNILQSSSAVELLCMKKIFDTQFRQLITGKPMVDTNFSLDLDSIREKFEQLANDAFQTESTQSNYGNSTSSPTLPGLP